ncbi:hypothetical protein L5I01_17395 [Gordonia sp. HY442]|uniref:DUF7352 domain-containing protein n=1 Tax=Gordonia zhenghanii TaxID=2911516 RepID=UPI001F15E6EB|nr:hypothetical protein [Gordonia zhenghanii]MCF8605132.1 hypothetical protein [Gordonia zhenghanii]
MTTIWKFSLDHLDDIVEIDMAGELVRWLHVEPRGAHDITLWAEVRPFEDWRRPGVSTHRVYVRGTGHELTGDEGAHIGTAVTVSGLVWHVFGDGRARQEAS